jgi:hypothetical protein
MRHKSVEKRSMYSARRSQIEHKVRAARQRTLAPTKRSEKGSPTDAAPDPGDQALRYEPPAYAGPPVAPPPPSKQAQAPAQAAWDAGPTAQPPIPPAPAYEPSAPAYEPPPPQVPPAQESAWSPNPPMAEPAQPEQAASSPAAPASTSAAAEPSWSIVGETKGIAEPEPVAKKKSKQDAQTSAWTLASGEVAGEEADDEPTTRRGVIAVAQYAVLVVGLVMVLIGVVVMVANSSGS